MVNALIRRTVPLVLLVCGACTDRQAAAAGDSTQAADSAASDATPAAERRSLSLPVAAEEVRDGDLVLSVVTTGQVRSDAEARLRADVTGNVNAVLVRPGDSVRKGQVLVRLDRRPFDLAVREAEEAIGEAEVRYRDAIVPDSIVTKQAPTEEQRRNATTRAGLASARVRLDKAKLDLERSVIVAPFAGVVDRVEVAAGERVQAGDLLTTVVDLANLRIEASVLEHDLPLIKEGGLAYVSSAASPDARTIGRVVAILPIIDSTTRAGRAYVRAPANNALRPGMYADVRLESTRLPGRRLVPARAVIERDGRPLVFVVKNGRALWTYITPGRTNGVDTEVLPDSTTGLIPIEPGDHVIVEGHLTLTHEAPVRVVRKDASSESRRAAVDKVDDASAGTAKP